MAICLEFTLLHLLLSSILRPDCYRSLEHEVLAHRSTALQLCGRKVLSYNTTKMGYMYCDGGDLGLLGLQLPPHGSELANLPRRMLKKMLENHLQTLCSETRLMRPIHPASSVWKTRWPGNLWKIYFVSLCKKKPASDKLLIMIYHPTKRQAVLPGYPLSSLSFDMLSSTVLWAEFPKI
ncbi:unnamed protein product [Cyclocybe aegerita]|uniref:Uncharacterized protein n=1 Tax=Cyclocybe aegerita TaxID=1973307 RepID=A0A8S0X1K1_CYCAE|nr:unnamed protein product [Cyclocybe aegerita]